MFFRKKKWEIEENQRVLSKASILIISFSTMYNFLSGLNICPQCNRSCKSAMSDLNIRSPKQFWLSAPNATSIYYLVSTVNPSVSTHCQSSMSISNREPQKIPITLSVSCVILSCVSLEFQCNFSITLSLPIVNASPSYKSSLKILNTSPHCQSSMLFPNANLQYQWPMPISTIVYSHQSWETPTKMWVLRPLTFDPKPRTWDLGLLGFITHPQSHVMRPQAQSLGLRASRA